MLRRIGQVTHRAQRRSRDEQPECGSERDATQSREDQPEPEAVEVAVHLGERAGQLDRDAGRRRHGDDPHVLAVHGRIPQVAEAHPAGCDRPVGGVDRDPDVLVGGTGGRAVGIDELHHRLLAGQW